MLLSLVWEQLKKHGKFLPFPCCPPLVCLQHSSMDPHFPEFPQGNTCRILSCYFMPPSSAPNRLWPSWFQFAFSRNNEGEIKVTIWSILQQNYIQLLDQNIHKVRNQNLYSLKEWCRLFLHCHKALHVETFIQQGMQMTDSWKVSGSFAEKETKTDEFFPTIK